jgi:hypothetical protein
MAMKRLLFHGRCRDIAAATLANTGRECTSVHRCLASPDMMILLREEKKGRIIKNDESEGGECHT